ncbi:MAG: regulatory protein RecX [Ectothiorhodospiraceae bacterium]|nr:regulatory protein RecX [Ectothiorhodospiraceae bacterium]MCH8504881.1 recombination regulator RecX [Ectothiorhodospiraceae bacterium]
MDQEALDSALETGTRLLARREHASQELRLKLLQRGFGPEVVEAALQELVRRNHLSDERFVEVYISHRCEQGYGPVRIVADLQARGVDEQVYRPFLNELQVDWTAMAREQKRRRFGAGRPGDRREWGRQGRFLASRGFTAEQVRQVLGEDDPEL